VRFSASASAGAAAESPRLPCRQTPLHYSTRNHASDASDAIAELLVCGAAVDIQNYGW
jgi:hypothetical protein